MEMDFFPLCLGLLPKTGDFSLVRGSSGPFDVFAPPLVGLI